MQRYVIGRIKQLLPYICIAFIISFGLSATCPRLFVIAAKEYTISGQTSQKLYESESESSKVVANVIPGNSFTILETVKDSQGRNWHHVSLPGGVTGYIIASRVIEVEEAAESQETPAVENADYAAQAEEQQEQEDDEAAQEDAEDEEDTQEDEAAKNNEENEEENETAENEGLASISVTTLSNTNLRDEPSLAGNILIVIPRGVTLRPLEKLERDNFFWYRLTYLEQTGYIRADAVEESEDPEEETTEEATEGDSVSTPASTTSKVVRKSSTSTVSYEDSYDRRHKWDDPEITSTDEKTAHKRFIDIYVIIFVFFAAVFATIAFFLLGNVFYGLKRHFRFIKKRRKQRGEGRWTK